MSNTTQTGLDVAILGILAAVNDREGFATSIQRVVAFASRLTRPQLLSIFDALNTEKAEMATLMMLMGNRRKWDAVDDINETDERALTPEVAAVALLASTLHVSPMLALRQPLRSLVGPDSLGDIIDVTGLLGEGITAVTELVQSKLGFDLPFDEWQQQPTLFHDTGGSTLVDYILEDFKPHLVPWLNL